MNLTNLQQIFSHYIEKFEYINNPTNNENYKWQVAKTFRLLMDDALSKEGEEFVEILYKAKASTFNIIDSYTQPFYGLVEFARKEPDTVKKMFLDLYIDDGGDLNKQQKKMEDFFTRSNELLEKYNSGSYRFKQSFHSVSAYLFLYDPDHHYMFKSKQASSFADCIGFLDDWGSGDHISLPIYYRMCDELVAEINKSDELIEINKSRFDGRFRVKTEELFEDSMKHMLAFDIIYCSSVYDLFDEISFTKLKTKEKKLYLERKKKSEKLLKEYKRVCKDDELLNEAKNYFISKLSPGTEIKHKKYGLGKVVSADEDYMFVSFSKEKETKQLSLVVALANGIIKSKIAGFDEKLIAYSPVLKRADLIERKIIRKSKELKSYEEFID